MNYLLDTSYIINYFKKGGLWYETIIKLAGEEGSQLMVSSITVAELYYGAVKSVIPRKEKEKIESFLEDFLVEIIPVTAEIAREYADLKRTIEKTGAPLDDFDLLIGATAKIKEATLLTDNQKHFKRVEGLKIYNND